MSMPESKVPDSEIKWAEALVDQLKRDLESAMEQIKDGENPYLVHVATRMLQSRSSDLEDLQGWLSMHASA